MDQKHLNKKFFIMFEHRNVRIKNLKKKHFWSMYWDTCTLIWIYVSCVCVINNMPQFINGRHVSGETEMWKLYISAMTSLRCSRRMVRGSFTVQSEDTVPRVHKPHSWLYHAINTETLKQQCYKTWRLQAFSVMSQSSVTSPITCPYYADLLMYLYL